MRSEASVVINRPIAEVFQLTNDDVPQWSIIVVSEEKFGDTPGVGAKFRTVTNDRGRQMEFDGEVTRWDPPYASAIHMVGKAFNIDAAYTFEDYDGRTRVTQVSNVQGKGLTKVMFFCLGWMFRKSSCDALQKELDSLKQFCEGQGSE